MTQPVTLDRSDGPDLNATREPAPDATRRRPLRRAWPVALYLVVAVVVFAREWAHPATVLPGFPDDNKSFLWGLQWFAWAPFHGHIPFVTNVVHAPGGINVLWNAWAPLLSFLLAPVTLLAGPIAAFNTFVTLAFVATGAAGWRAATRFVRPGTAVVVGLAVELCPFMVNHGPEDPMLVFAVFPPLVLLLVTDLVRGERPARRTGLLLGLATGLQVWVDEEIAADVALVGAAGGLVALIVLRHRIRPYVGPLVTAVGLAAAVAVVIALPVLLIQFGGPNQLHDLLRPAQTQAYIDLRTVVEPGRNTVPGRLLGLGQGVMRAVETGGYLGIVSILAAASAIALRRRTSVTLLALTGLVVGALATGDSLRFDDQIIVYPMPWSALAKLPLVGQLQQGRLSLEIFLFVSLVAAAGVERLITRSRLTGVAVTVLAAVSLLPVAPVTETTRPVVPEFFRDHARNLPAGCLAAVAPVAYAGSNDDAMVWQEAAHFRFRMMGGYVLAPAIHGQMSTYGAQPYPITAFLVRHGGQQPVVGDPSAEEVRADLRRLGVCAVIAGSPATEGPLITSLTGVLGPPAMDQGVAIWRLPLRQ